MNCDAVRQILAESLNLDTGCHSLYILFTQVTSSTIFACFSTTIASVDTGLDFEAFLALTQLPIQEHIIYTPAILLLEELMLPCITTSVYNNVIPMVKKRSGNLERWLNETCKRCGKKNIPPEMNRGRRSYRKSGSVEIA